MHSDVKWELVSFLPTLHSRHFYNFGAVSLNQKPLQTLVYQLYQFIVDRDHKLVNWLFLSHFFTSSLCPIVCVTGLVKNMFLRMLRTSAIKYKKGMFHPQPWKPIKSFHVFTFNPCFFWEFKGEKNAHKKNKNKRPLKNKTLESLQT